MMRTLIDNLGDSEFIIKQLIEAYTCLKCKTKVIWQ